MAQELIQINVRKLPVRILLLLLLLPAAAGSYSVVRWYLGNTLAEYFNTEAPTLEAAQRAASLAPDDPLTHWRMAQVSQKVLSLEQQAQAIFLPAIIATGCRWELHTNRQERLRRRSTR
jgi:hypothetical protein